jgi:hypothetical protein
MFAGLLVGVGRQEALGLLVGGKLLVGGGEKVLSKPSADSFAVGRRQQESLIEFADVVRRTRTEYCSGAENAWSFVVLNGLPGCRNRYKE